MPTMSLCQRNVYLDQAMQHEPHRVCALFHCASMPTEPPAMGAQPLATKAAGQLLRPQMHNAGT